MQIKWGFALIALLPLVSASTNSADSKSENERASKAVTILRLLKKILEEKKAIVKRQTAAIKTYGGNSAGANCVFPHIYEGKAVFACICKYDSTAWCSTTDDYVKDRKWGYCIQGSSSNAVAFGRKPGGTCVLPFLLNHQEQKGCPCFSNATYPWCSVSRVFEFRGSWKFCAITACPDDYCKNGAECNVESKPYNENEPHFRCACKSGFEGARCDVKSCPPGFCQNGGTCSTEKDGAGFKFKCSCPAFQGGTKCEKDAECGKPSLSPERRIIGGKVAKAHSWPWQTSIVYSPRGDFKNPQMSYHKCGGTVITPYWILTAAHCVDWYNRETRQGYRDLTPTHYKIKLGDHSRGKVEPAEEMRDVEKIFVFPNWDYTTFSNDVALIKVTKEIRYNDHVRPICLPKKKAAPNQFCFLTGWGRTKGYVFGQAPELMEVKLKLLPQDQCEGLNQFNRDHVHCFGYTGTTHMGACRGDSGGPVNCMEDKRWVQVGIASFVRGRYCEEGQSFYAEVYDYVDWIKKTVLSN